MTIAEFEEIVADAVDDVPEDLKPYLASVDVRTAPLPSLGQRRRMRLRSDEALYGLYEGVTVPDRLTHGDSGQTPSVVTVFRVPLRQDFTDEAELKRQIRRTVFHELAHHFGIDDDALEAWGVY